MITAFHTICIIARYVYVVLSESLLGRFQNCISKENEPITFKDSKYHVSSECYCEEGYGPKFVPQLFVQRYLTVKQVLEDEEWKGSIRKVVEFGCANFGFFPYLKKLTGVQEILGVDVDHNILVDHYNKVSPLNCDYLFQRNEPLTVFVWEGNIAYADKCLAGCDAVVCIELIEHLYPDVLEEVPYTVFGVIKPRVAIFTTPNGEFNVLFPDPKRFRHPDHKFEWTREQFKNWANNIVLRYPEYEVSLHGIGWGPDGTESVGTCSQMAVFKRHTPPPPSNGPIEDVRINDTKQGYQLLRKCEYPFYIDTRTEREKILEQAVYSLQMLSTAEEFMEDIEISIPLIRLLSFLREYNPSVEELEDILKEAGWELVPHKSGCLAVVVPTAESTSSDEPFECDVLQGTYNDDQEYCKTENWDAFESELSAQEKWDCDSVDLHFQNGDISDNSMIKLNDLSSWPELPVASDDIKNREESVPSTSWHVSANDPLKHEGVCSSSPSVDIRPVILEKFAVSELPCGDKPNSLDSDIHHTEFGTQSSVLFAENMKEPMCLSIGEADKCEHTINCSCGEQNCSCSATVTAKANSCAIPSSCVTQLQFVGQDLPHRTGDSKLSESHHHSDDPLHFLKSSASDSLYLNLQAEAQDTSIETNKKQEGFTDSPAAGSVSLEEPNDRLADSGYPNSTSAQDMDLDLTPEQVDELFTENDVITDHPPDHHSDSVSVSSRDSDSVSEPQQVLQPPPMVMPQPDVLFEEAMNVENGDVANNNRDGEGNNVLAVGALLNEGGGDAGDDNAVAVGIVLPENFDDLIPLFAAAEDIDNDNEIEINVVEPFPPWLLNMLGLANGGGAVVGGGGDEGEENVPEHESSDDDSDNNPGIDEGLGDEYNLDSSSLSDTCPSDLGPESDVGGEVAAINP